MIRAGERRCEFCGWKVPVEGPGRADSRAAHKPAAARFNLFAVAAAVLAVAGYFGVQSTARRSGPVPPRQIRMDDKQQAYKLCEEYLRRHPPTTYSVASVASGLVATERDGFVVSGTVELQDPAGAGVKRRYSCKVRPDAAFVLRLEEGRIY